MAIPSYILDTLEAYLEFVNGRKIALWGMGQLGKEFLAQYSDKNITLNGKNNIECFDQKKGEYSNIDVINNRKDDYYVIVSFICGYDEAESQLKKMGFKEITDYICLGKFSEIVNHPRIPEYVYKKKKLWFPSNHNQELFVLGNGPSLRLDLNKHSQLFTMNDCMVVNAMSQNTAYERIKPRYYAMLDPVYWSDTILDDPSQAIWYEAIEAIIKKTTWKLLFFIPYFAKCAKSVIQRIRLNRNIKIVYVYTNPLEGKISDSLRYQLYDEGFSMPLAQNVLVYAIFLGIRLQYKIINLYGADHSWTEKLKSTKQGLYIYEEHFYDTPEEDHFEILINYGTNQPFTSREFFQCLSRMFQGYEELAKYAQYKNVRIINKTPESFIDAFPHK